MANGGDATRQSDLDRLFAADPRAFVRTRDAIAGELRARGDTEAAAEAARMRKPSPALWAVNQLARHAGPELARLLDVVARLRVTGAGRNALAEHREALGALTRRAGDILRQADSRPSPAVLTRITSTLRGAAADREGATRLGQGRLTREYQAPGIEILADIPAAPAPIAAVQARPQKPAGRERLEATSDTPAALRAAEAAARRARDEARKVEHRAARAQGRVQALRQQVADAEEDLERLRNTLQAEEAAMARLRAQAADAKREAEARAAEAAHLQLPIAPRIRTR
jgi:hypothetical protein